MCAYKRTTKGVPPSFNAAGRNTLVVPQNENSVLETCRKPTQRDYDLALTSHTVCDPPVPLDAAPTQQSAISMSLRSSEAPSNKMLCERLLSGPRLQLPLHLAHELRRGVLLILHNPQLVLQPLHFHLTCRVYL